MDWVALAALVPSRMKRQCEDRWKRQMDPCAETALNRAPALGQDPHPLMQDELMARHTSTQPGSRSFLLLYECVPRKKQ
jgi:hypothetical protein